MVYYLFECAHARSALGKVMVVGGGGNGLKPNA